MCPRSWIGGSTGDLGGWRAHYAWAYRLRGPAAWKWSGSIPLRHRHFALIRLCLDAAGEDLACNWIYARVWFLVWLKRGLESQSESPRYGQRAGQL